MLSFAGCRKKNQNLSREVTHKKRRCIRWGHNHACFLPRGIGVGLDCLSSECFVDGEPIGYDGTIDSVQICPDDSNLACSGRTNYQVAAGHVALFHRDPTQELATHPQKTILLALPIDTPNVVNFRVRALEVVVEFC